MDTKKQKVINLLNEFRDYSGLLPDAEKIADKIIEALNEDKFVPPLNSDCVDYIYANELMNDKSLREIYETGELFLNYYESVGWVVGKSKKQMKSWKKALNNWCKRDWSKKSNAKSRVEESIKAFMMLQKSK